MPAVTMYVAPDGHAPFQEWLATQDGTTAARIAVALARMRAGNFGDAKGVGDGVVERRLHFGPGYRLYYGTIGDEIVVMLAGGTKKRQRRDIRQAKDYWTDYLTRRQTDDGPTDPAGLGNDRPEDEGG